MTKVLLIGATPPPIGGVSMHIQRFVEQFQDHDPKYHLDVLDLKKRELYSSKKRLSLIQIFRTIGSSSIIHLHISSNLKILVACLSKVLGKKVVYTHHNIRIKNQFFFKLFMFFVDKLILVNDKDIDQRIRQKYKYTLIPAFLPSMDKTKLPISLENALDRFDHVISTNCFEMTFVDGRDLYGFDLCVKSFNKLVQSNAIKNTVLVLVDPSGSSKEYVYKLLKNFTPNNGCEILFVGESINFNALIEVSSVVLRATRSDGDSLTVREALYLQTPIIASDVTIRPKGTICFKNEDSSDLALIIKKVLDSKTSKPKIKYENVNYGKAVFDLYSTL